MTEQERVPGESGEATGGAPAEPTRNQPEGNGSLGAAAVSSTAGAALGRAGLLLVLTGVATVVAAGWRQWTAWRDLRRMAAVTVLLGLAMQLAP